MIDQKAIDDVVNIFLPAIHIHRKTSAVPFVLGLSGLQGSGKSTWAAALRDCFTTKYGLETRIISLDDLYHDHAELEAIKKANPGNGLLQTRGQPGTHDENLARKFFNRILNKTPNQNWSSSIRWPAYDKSLHNGQGGRVPQEEWENVSLTEKLDVIIFEGWCLGFKPISAETVARQWKEAKAQPSDQKSPIQTLADHDISHLMAINDNLQRYNASFTGRQNFNGFLHLSTDELNHVYEWRLSQERALRKHKPGMTDDQVVQFVKGYMPAYELFLDHLQQESFFREVGVESSSRKHVQIVLNQDRDVVQIRALA